MTGLGLAASESNRLLFLISSCIDWRLTVILTLRTWAVWNRDRRLSIILPIFFTLVEGSGFVIIGIYLNSIKCR